MTSVGPSMTFTELPHPEHDAQFYEGLPAKRAIAWVIDTIIILLGGLFCALVLGVLTLGVGFIFFPAIMFMAAFFYRWLTIAGASSTYGMAMMGIEFRSRTGHRLDPMTAAFHTGIYLFLMFTVVGWFISIASVLATRYHQSIPDLILGTTAINRPLD